jgi:hypothetical protein
LKTQMHKLSKCKCANAQLRYAIVMRATILAQVTIQLRRPIKIPGI